MSPLFSLRVSQQGQDLHGYCCGRLRRKRAGAAYRGGAFDGRMDFAYAFKKPLIFEAALVDGNVYVGTGDGLLICLQTTNKDADGWYGWGGNAEHNK